MRPRPALILGLALAVLALVPLWGALGFLGQEESAHGAGGHGGHGAVEDADAMKETFAAETKAWIASHTRSDGCVEPSSPGEGGDAESMEGMDMEGMDHSDGAASMKEEDHSEAGGEEGHGDEGEEHMEGMEGMEGMDMEHGNEHPLVYLQAVSFGYLPPRLCLKSGVTYQFRAMATDVTHGAAIQMDTGSKMLRLPPASEVSEDVTFSEPGEYLVYCTSYCGIGHNFMMGQIIVERGRDEQASSTAPTGS